MNEPYMPPAGENPQDEGPANTVVPAVDPVRSAAGRLGAKRVHELAELGREYEREHGFKPGRQRLKQLIQLGRRSELERGLRAPKILRHKGDAWQEFASALARVVKPKHRPAVEGMVAALRQAESPPAQPGSDSTNLS